MARNKLKEEYIDKDKEVCSGSSPSEQLKSLLKDSPKDHYNFQDRVEWKISSGSLLIDIALGGYIYPSLIRITGQNNEGKSPQCLEICRNFLKDVDNSRVVWFLAEGRLSKENKERCGLNFVTNPDEWTDKNSILLIESNVYEFIIKMIKDLVLNNPEKKKYCFVIDSIDGLIRREDLDRPPEDSAKVCGPQVLSKKMMQSLSIGMFKFGHLMLLVSQITAAPKINQYEKVTDRGGEFSGGNSLLHSADFIISYEKSYSGDYILDNPSGKLNDGKSKPIGKFAKIILDKSAIESSKKQKIQYPIKFGRKPSGVWLEYEIIDVLLSFDLLKKAGAWLTVSDSIIIDAKEKGIEFEKQHQGIDKLRKYIEDNESIRDFLYNKVKNVLMD